MKHEVTTLNTKKTLAASLKRFFYTDFIGITKSIIHDTEQQLGIHAEEQFKEMEK